MENNKRTFSIFQVYDYKGGELCTYTNLSETTLYSWLSELFEELELDRSIPDIAVEEIEDELRKIENGRDFYSSYACGDGFVGEIYEHIDNKLVKISIKDCIPGIAKYIKERW